MKETLIWAMWRLVANLYAWRPFPPPHANLVRVPEQIPKLNPKLDPIMCISWFSLGGNL